MQRVVAGNGQGRQWALARLAIRLLCDAVTLPAELP
jgi:hypothetical protein